jgi:hypothetical protein
MSCNLEAVRFLLKAKANPRHTSSYDLTPLHFAARAAHLGRPRAARVVELLLHRRAPKTVNAKDIAGFTPLQHACTVWACDQRGATNLALNRDEALVKKRRTEMVDAVMAFRRARASGHTYELVKNECADDSDSENDSSYDRVDTVAHRVVREMCRFVYLPGALPQGKYRICENSFYDGIPDSERRTASYQKPMVAVIGQSWMPPAIVQLGHDLLCALASAKPSAGLLWSSVGGMRPVDIAARHGCADVLDGVLSACEKFPPTSTAPSLPPLAFLFQRTSISMDMIDYLARYFICDPFMHLKDGTLLHYAVERNLPEIGVRYLIESLNQAAISLHK